jgi:hypothetical protein
MNIIAIVCWPDCPNALKSEIRRLLNNTSEYAIKADATTLDTILMQLFDEEIVAHHHQDAKQNSQTPIFLDPAFKTQFLGQGKTCLCVFGEYGKAIPKKYLATKYYSAITVFAEARAVRIADFFERPLLVHQDITSPLTPQLLKYILNLRDVISKRQLNCVLWIDASMAAYGMRCARQTDAVSGLVFYTNKKLTVKETSAGLALVRNYIPGHILRAHHNLDVLSVASNKANTAFFCGLKVLVPSEAYKYARALSTVPPDHDVFLLDAVILKMVNEDKEVNLPFVDGVQQHSVVNYSARANAHIQAYKTITSELAKAICTSRVDARFSVLWNPSPNADTVIEKYKKITGALKGEPAFPVYYGKVACENGQFGVASEAGFETTLAGWIITERPKSDIAFVLMEVARAALALSIAGYRHTNLTASHVVLKITDGVTVVRIVSVTDVEEVPVADVNKFYPLAKLANDIFLSGKIGNSKVDSRSQLQFAKAETPYDLQEIIGNYREL